jgi:hypothetical protein
VPKIIRISWCLVQELGLDAEMGCCWVNFLVELGNYHMQLMYTPNELKWALNLIGGEYMVKLGHKSLLPQVGEEVVWW